MITYIATILFCSIPLIVLVIDQLIRAVFGKPDGIYKKLLIKTEEKIISLEKLLKVIKENKCAYCNSALPSEAKFCSYCGTSQ